MHVKWFFVIFGLGFTFMMLLAILFMGSMINQQGAQRFDNSSTVHKYLYDNITGLRLDWNTKLAPILDQVPNATQMKLDQDKHYNQTSEDFKKIGQVLEIKLQDHVTLGIMNQSISKILQILNNSGTTNVTVVPIPVPVINNVTEKNEGNLTSILR